MSTKIKFFLGALAIAVVAFTANTSAQTYSFSGTLKQGSRGASVWNLQKFLNMCPATRVASMGAGSPGMETQTFGPATKAAVIRFQAANGLTADGVFGPMSASKAMSLQASGMPCGTVVVTPGGNLPAGCVPGAMFSSTTGQPCSGSNNNPGGNTNSGSLKGTVGDLDYDQVSSLNNEEVGEDEDNVKVAGLELDAEDSDSDVQITSVKIAFCNASGENAGNCGTDNNSANATADFEDVADEVSVWLGNTKVATVDADEFNDDNDYEKTIALSNAIVRMDDTEDLVVAVSGASNLDSSDIADSTNNWDVFFTQIRYVDAQGATTTDSDPLGATSARTFEFESFASANDVELEVALNEDEDDINDAHTIKVDDNDETNDVAILAFTLKADGDSDILVKEVPVLLTTSDSDIRTVVSSVDLYHGSNKIASEDVDANASTDTVVFDDLDLTIDSGDTEEFWVKVSLLDLSGNYSSGTTIKAEITSTEVAAIDAEDESEEDLTGNELTGSALAQASSLFSGGIDVDVLTRTTNIITQDGATNDNAEFVFEIKVTNIGDDAVYVNADAADIVTSSTAGDVDDVYAIQYSGGAALTAVSATIVDTTDATEVMADATAYQAAYNGENFYRIASGSSETFRITITGTNATDSKQVRAYLSSIEWTTDDITSATAKDAVVATINSYSAQLQSDSETPYKVIN